MLRFFKNIYHLLVAILANILYGFPSNRLNVIGITGTKGKTTTADLIYQILIKSGCKVGVINTIGGKIGNKNVDTGLHVSTPNAIDLQKYLRMAVKQGIKWMVIEATSHGLDQYRLLGIRFDIGIFTNIASDHLDYHKTWNNYVKAKAKLIKQVKKGGIIVLNKDDKNYGLLNKLSQMARVQVITYGIENKTSDFVATKISQSIDGVFFSLFNRKKGDFKKYMIRMLGDFNIYNAMIAIMIANILNINDKHIHKTLKNVITPIGRMEIMQKNPFVVIVDFAHNPFSLMTSLNNLITIKQSPFSKIITVFGCPGLRDKSRRTMGKVSAELSDITIITADDPRTEKVEDINNEIAIWADKAGAKEIKKELYKKQKYKNHIYIKIPDRKEAISFAIKIAQKGDIVYVTGKGHEKSICYGIKEYPWSDQKVINNLLASKNTY